MMAVIFEVTPAEGQRERYLDIAARLRPQLEAIDGFLSVERFQSLTQPGRLLSLSFWRDEDAVRRWREVEAHRTAQRAGRDAVFDDYRLRVATVVRDYGMFERDEAPQNCPAKVPPRAERRAAPQPVLSRVEGPAGIPLGDRPTDSSDEGLQ